MGINNPSRVITQVSSRTKILKTYPQRFKYKIFLLHSILLNCPLEKEYLIFETLWIRYGSVDAAKTNSIFEKKIRILIPDKF